jgi:protein SCO1
MRSRLAIVLPLLALTALVVVVAVVLIDNSSTPSAAPSTGTSTSGDFDGAPLPGDTQAPNFTLTDQDGHSVSLRQYRGRVTVIAFLYSTCGATCVVIAEQIRGALDELRTQPAVLIVSAAPAADTPAHVSRFLREVSLTGRVRYLRGSAAQLRPIWHAYKVTPASAGRRVFDSYASVMLVDGHGAERVLFEQEQLTPESLSHDIGKLQDG